MTTDQTGTDAQFGVEDCTCIPFTRQTNPPRYLNWPTDTVDMISGWERGADCPHHAASVSPPATPADAPSRRAELRYRIAKALLPHNNWDGEGLNVDMAADAVLAVRDTELADARARVAQVEDLLRIANDTANQSEAARAEWEATACRHANLWRNEQEASRRLLDQRQEMAEERFAWQERGDKAEARVAELEQQQTGQRAATLREAADIAESLRQFEPAFGARKSAQVSENVGILRVAAELRRLADETPAGGQAPEADPIGISGEICPGFPDRCPNLRTVEPEPGVHLGGIRCGCADETPATVEAEHTPEQP